MPDNELTYESIQAILEISVQCHHEWSVFTVVVVEWQHS